MTCLGISIALSLFILALFYMLGTMSTLDLLGGMSFECGFGSYFFSRFSFSVHFYLVALIFLFLDLELCFILPIFVSEETKWEIIFCSLFFLTALLMGLVEEWVEGKLNWNF